MLCKMVGERVSGNAKP